MGSGRPLTGRPGMTREFFSTLLKAPLREKPILGARPAEIFAQGLAFVLAPEEAAALQFRDAAVDEIVEAARYIWEHDVEAVAGVDPLAAALGGVALWDIGQRPSRSKPEASWPSAIDRDAMPLSGCTEGENGPCFVCSDVGAGGY